MTAMFMHLISHSMSAVLTLSVHRTSVHSASGAVLSRVRDCSSFLKPTSRLSSGLLPLTLGSSVKRLSKPVLTPKKTSISRKLSLPVNLAVLSMLQERLSRTFGVLKSTTSTVYPIFSALAPLSANTMTVCILLRTISLLKLLIFIRAKFLNPVRPVNSFSLLSASTQDPLSASRQVISAV